MAVVVVILIIAALAGGVVWNHQHAHRAQAGVELTSPVPPSTVVARLDAAYCVGAKAKVKAGVLGVKVTKSGANHYAYGTKYGDAGKIVVESSGTGSRVVASTSNLFVGSPSRFRPRSGIFALSAAITAHVYAMLGITPGAIKMLRFQNGVQRLVARSQ